MRSWPLRLGRVVLSAALVLFLVSVLVFALAYLAPGSIESTLLGGRPASPELVASIRAQYRLDDPVPIQYLAWLRAALTGDLGVSGRTQEAVTVAIADRIGLTLQLVAGAATLAVVLGVSAGVLAAVKQGRPWDRAMVGTSVVGVSIPSFVAATVLILVFGVTLDLLPISGEGSGGADRFAHLAMPWVALSLLGLSYVVKVTRTAMIQALDRESVAFAKSRGVPTSRVLTVHALRPSLVPIITAIGLVSVAMLGFTILVEVPFALNGLGSLLAKSIAASDIPVIQGVTLAIAAVIIAINLATDAACIWLDPQARGAARG